MNRTGQFHKAFSLRVAKRKALATVCLCPCKESPACRKQTNPKRLVPTEGCCLEPHAQFLGWFCFQMKGLKDAVRRFPRFLRRGLDLGISSGALAEPCQQPRARHMFAWTWVEANNSWHLTWLAPESDGLWACCCLPTHGSVIGQVFDANPCK